MSNRTLANIIEAIIIIPALWYWIFGEVPNSVTLWTIIFVGFSIHLIIEILGTLGFIFLYPQMKWGNRDTLNVEGVDNNQLPKFK